MARSRFRGQPPRLRLEQAIDGDLDPSAWCYLGRSQIPRMSHRCPIKWTERALQSNICGMPKRGQVAFPRMQRQAHGLGLRLRQARLRRRMSAATMAERAGLSRDTLHRLEKGDVSISLAGFLRVLQVLGLADDVDGLARDDELGRKLQDINQPGPRRPRSERGVQRGGDSDA
jgi:transcriptional regulator with XRE-family HTH domain